MALSDEHKISLSFKKLINKEFTDDSRAFYEEQGTRTLDLDINDIYSSFIPEDITLYTSQITSPVAGEIYILTGSDGTGIVKWYNQVDLSADPSFDDVASNRKVWYVISSSAGVGGAYNADNVQRNFLSDKYGGGYSFKATGESRIYDGGGSSIPLTDPIDWYFDCKTGILSIQDPGSYSTPYKLSAFQYIGNTLSASLASGELGGGGNGSGTGIFAETGSWYNTTNNVGITGSFEVGGANNSVDFTTAGGGVSGSFSGSFEGAFTAGTINASSVTAAQGTFTDLTVTGTTTTVNTTNLNIEDQFILINSGALKGPSLAAVDADKDGGLIVDFGGGSGSALFYDAANRAWGIKGTDHTSTDQSDFLGYNAVSNEDTSVKYDYTLTVVSASTANPSIAPTYGNSATNSELGTMHINHNDGTIWIYS